VRSFSSRALTSIFAHQTDEVWLVLLTLDHPDFEEPLRFVNNVEAIVSRGEIYIPFPFMVEFPGQDPEAVGEARLRIDNIDRQIVNTIREIQSPPDAKFEVIIAADADTIEAKFEGLTLRNASYDVQQVTGSLRYEEMVSEPVSLEMTPARFPGMF
jgi:hypothetical protein